MNYLAHTLLSTKDIDFQLGNLLSDTLKGRLWQGSSVAHHNGMEMHQAIDMFTDANPVFRRAKSRLGQRGYLKGVIIDIAFDHYLSKHWQRYTTLPLPTFVETFNYRAINELHRLPNPAIIFIERIVDNNILASYTTLDDLAFVFERLNKRLSPRLLAREKATDYLPYIEANYEAIEADFLAFFPQLITFFLQKSQATSDNHWLKPQG